MKRDRKFCREYHKEQIKYIVNALSRRIIDKNLFEQNYDREVYSAECGNEKIYQALISGEPFMAGRFGGNEIRVISDILFEKEKGMFGGLSQRMRYKITNQAGFFPDDVDMLYQFQELYMDCCQHVDLLGVWNMFLQGEITKRYLPQAMLSELRGIEPYYYKNPWTKALEGKKVLVIHPFAQSIEQQYAKREYLFENPDILPEFSLKTLKAVQTIAGQKDERYDTWFEALNDMYEKAMQEDFEVALIGCGAYGFPLAARLKAAGKQVVHMGGALQILFGIKGKRWDNHEYISTLYNDYWTRPMEAELVKNSQVVESSCYW